MYVIADNKNIKPTRSTIARYTMINGQFDSNPALFPRLKNHMLSSQKFSVFKPRSEKITIPFRGTWYKPYQLFGALNNRTIRPHTVFSDRWNVRCLLKEGVKIGVYKPSNGRGSMFLLKWRECVYKTRNGNLKIDIRTNSIGTCLENKVVYKPVNTPCFTAFTMTHHKIGKYSAIMQCETDAFTHNNTPIEITCRPRGARAMMPDKMIACYLGNIPYIHIFNHDNIPQSRRRTPRNVEAEFHDIRRIRISDELQRITEAFEFIDKNTKLGELQIFIRNGKKLVIDKNINAVDQAMFDLGKNNVDRVLAHIPLPDIKEEEAKKEDRKVSRKVSREVSREVSPKRNRLIYTNSQPHAIPKVVSKVIPKLSNVNQKHFNWAKGKVIKQKPRRTGVCIPYNCNT